MKLDLTQAEGKMLNVILDHLYKHQDNASKILAGYQQDLDTLSGLAAKVRGAYTMASGGTK
jgi:hypothetical protein